MLTDKKYITSISQKPIHSLIFLWVIIEIIILSIVLTAILILGGDIPAKLSNYIIKFIIVLLLLLITAFSIVLCSILLIYKRKKINPRLEIISRIGFNLLMPFIISFSELFKAHKNNISLFYINLNNIIVRSGNAKYSCDRILVLLPHCLQSSSCEYKITNCIKNCRSCNMCDIGRIREITEKYNINAIEVVPGGTSARNAVLRHKPHVIIAVACERDLAAGISDVKKIPTIGILNKRLNGPCMDTTISLEEFDDAIKSVADLYKPQLSFSCITKR